MSCFRCLARNARCDTISHLTADAVFCTRLARNTRCNTMSHLTAAGSSAIASHRITLPTDGMLRSDMRGWRNTVELVLFGISNSMKPEPSIFHAHTRKLRPFIYIFEPNNLDGFPTVFHQPLMISCGLMRCHTAAWHEMRGFIEALMRAIAM